MWPGVEKGGKDMEGKGAKHFREAVWKGPGKRLMAGGGRLLPV